MSDCAPQQQGEWYICQRCGWGKGKMRTPYRRNCPVPLAVNSPELMRLIGQYCGDGCNGRKVSQSQFGQRAEHCDKCEHREGLVCMLAPADRCELAVLLAHKSYTCLGGRRLSVLPEEQGNFGE